MILNFAAIFLTLTAVIAEKNYTDFVQHIKANIENKTGDFYHGTYNMLTFISIPMVLDCGFTTIEIVVLEMMNLPKKMGSTMFTSNPSVTSLSESEARNLSPSFHQYQP